MHHLKLSLIGLLLLLPGLAAAQTTSAATFTVGTLQVVRYGDHGRPLILIPGMGSGAWVWQDSIEHFKNDHVIYAVTLAGFDGTPAPADDNLGDQTEASLLQLIESRRIEKPVLIGHSLGGALAIRFAEQHAALLAGVVSVDALPVFPGTEAINTSQRQRMAAEFQADASAMTPEQFNEEQRQIMRNGGVLDATLAKKLAVLQERSSAAAIIRYTVEGMTYDLRPGLGNISVPLLEISPYYAADFSEGPMKMTETEKTAQYQALLKGAPQAQVVSISPARHFVMYDQPEKFHKVLTDFLDKLSPR